MVSSTATALLGIAGWAYIPDFATRHCLSFLHQFLRYRGHHVPQPNTLAWARHYRYVFAIVVLGYLSYNLIEASRTAPPNFFEILGVSPSSDVDGIAKAFRAFAKKNHPDRVGKDGEALFVTVRDAYEAVKNPVTRFAYERFGPDIMAWRDCKTEKEFLRKGLLQSSGFYISSSVILLLMSAMMKPSPVAFWRYLLLVGLFASELSLAVGYTSFHIFTVAFPHRVPFQHIRILHQLFVFLSFALSRVFPVLFPDSTGINPADPRTYAPYLNRLSQLAKSADRELTRMLHTELHALQGTKSTIRFSTVGTAQPSDEDIEKLTLEMENMVVEQQLRVEAPFQPLIAAALERGREVFLARTRRAKTRPAPLQRISSTSPVKRGLPSPPGGSVSPEFPPADLPNGHGDVAYDLSIVGDGDGDGNSDRRLPSPRPSPPPLLSSSSSPRSFPVRTSSPMRA